MPNTKSFTKLRDEARRDPARARRIDGAKTTRALEEQARYRLAELRQALGITQAELAELIGKSQSAISQIENGEIGLSLDVLRQIVAQLGGEVEVTAVFKNRRVTLDA
jgi:DNA-binding XRE family transcriptional regulator